MFNNIHTIEFLSRLSADTLERIWEGLADDWYSLPFNAEKRKNVREHMILIADLLECDMTSMRCHLVRRQ